MSADLKLPPRSYYSLAQAAKEIGRDEDYLIHLAAIGEVGILTLRHEDCKVFPLIDPSLYPTYLSSEAVPIEISANEFFEKYFPPFLRTRNTFLGLWPWAVSDIELFGKSETDSFCDAIILSHIFMGDAGGLCLQISKNLEENNLPFQCDAFISTDNDIEIKLTAILGSGNISIEKLINEIHKIERISFTITRENLFITHLELQRLLRGEPSGSIKNFQKDDPRLKGLNAINKAKHEALETAKQIARVLWAEDKDKTVRIGEMADRVYRHLVTLGKKDALPATAETLKDWIKPVAPAYASKGGNRKQTP